MSGTTTAIVLAAGAGSRFGGGKLTATFAGKPLLQHVLDRVAEAGVGETVVVLGSDAEAIEADHLASRAQGRAGARTRPASCSPGWRR
jgi:CTP:molybdopterin cytidylyltransferase MocA